MDPARRAFYEYHAAMMDHGTHGVDRVYRRPADQRHARSQRPAPLRYIVTDDDLVIMGSECGCLPVPEERIVKKWRLQPGKMFLVDLEKGRIVDDKELKDTLANMKPYAEWIERIRIKLDEVESDKQKPERSAVALLDRQQAFAYTQEDVKFLMTPMAQAGEEPIGSMGNDSPMAVLSNKDKTLYHYFKQLFAQVTNPPIDPIREELVLRLCFVISRSPTSSASMSSICRCGSKCRSRCSISTRWKIVTGAHRRQVQILRARHHLPCRLGQGGVEAKLASL
jgi:glutamate synthase (NADPH/NADH) large chain